MAETGAAFAGIRCRCKRVARSRGYDPDLATIEVPTTGGFTFVPAGPGDATGPVELRLPDPSGGGTQVRAKRTDKPEWPKNVQLVAAGTLVLWEVDEHGVRHQAVAHPMFVKAAERTRSSVTGEELWTVTLMDERAFWGRGFMRAWSFNRARGDGSAAKNALRPDGSPWTLYDVASAAVASLPRARKLVAYPPEWGAGAGPLGLPPFCPGISALRVLEDEHHVEPPCLRWDGNVALHRAGDGTLGYARDGRGANNAALPPDLRLWKNGTGDGRVFEPTWPDDVIVVRGRERVETVALDGWEPVLLLRARQREDGGPQSANAKDVELPEGDEVGAPRVLLLDNDTVQALSEGLLTLDGLRRWVLQPLAYQDAVGLDEQVARLFREQAWRLWRLPGAVVAGQAVGPDGKALDGVFEVPGPNAHMLPLLDRAETIAGRRVPPTVQTFRFRTRHRLLSGTDTRTAALQKSKARKAKIREQASSLARLNGKRDPFAGKNEAFASGTLSVSELLGDKIGLTGDASTADLQRAIDAQRVVESLRDVDAGLAGEYEKELDLEARAAEELSGKPETALRGIARKAAAFERQVKEAATASRLASLGTLRADERTLSGIIERKGDDVTGVPQNARALRETFRESIAEDLRALQRNAEETRTRERAGVTAQSLLPPERGATFVQNAPRTEDVGARVVSPELGIVEVSRLPGHVEKEGVPSPADTRFVPQAVRVVFGAVRRPRYEGSPGDSVSQGSQVRAKQQPGAGPGDLRDGVTWFARAFRRAAPGVATPMPVEAVPLGEGTVVAIDDHELVPLVGAGNTAALEEKARKIAEDRFKPQPVVESATYVVGRPHMVQPDGKIRSVEIVERLDGKGYETRITVGLGSYDPNPMRTRTRPPTPKDRGDGDRREGTTP